MTDDFSEIRPYNNEELSDAIEKVLNDESFLTFVHQFKPQMTKEQLAALFHQMHTTFDVHRLCGFPLLKWLEDNKTDGLTFSDFNKVTLPTLFISNHRDIVVDPAFLNYILMSNHINTTEIGIGDNLLVSKWLQVFVRMAKCFIVQRSLPSREMPRALMQLSAYIRYVILEKQSSIWIAQREGRAKDSDDRTQESILKMFAISGDGSFIDNLKALNISPVTISYEYDPCDFLKAKEFQQKRDNQDFKKSIADDVLSMKTGILGFKGCVHYAFAPSINADLDTIALQTANKKEQVSAVARLIDRQIHRNYIIYPINKVAYDCLLGSKRFESEYTADEKTAVLHYFDSQVAKIDLQNADIPFLRHKILEMYANPLINFLVAHDNE